MMKHNPIITNSSATANLTTEGNSDWVHWVGGSVIRKSGGGSQINISGASGNSYSNDPRALSWSDGTPTASGSDNSGIFNQVQFVVTVPADTQRRDVIIYAGGFSSSASLTAQLSDGSRPNFVDNTVFQSGSWNRNYSINYRAASSGQTLTITWVITAGVSGGGNITLNGVALSTR